MVTAKEYADAPQTDAATAYGMRIAMFQAIKAWHALHPDQQTVASARRLIQDASRNNPLLQGAGTTELVARYYGHVIDRQPNTLAIINFLNSIPPEKVAKVDDALAKLEKGESVDKSDLLQAAGAFSIGARSHLGIQTLTDDFKAAIRGNSVLTDNLTIEPQPLNSRTAQLIASADRSFRTADWLDDQLFHIGKATNTLSTLQSFGIGFPAVAHLLGKASPATEMIFGTVRNITSATQLDTAARIKELQQQFAALAQETGAKGVMPTLPALTEVQLRRFATETEQTIRQYRAGMMDVDKLTETIQQRITTANQDKRTERQGMTGGITLAGVTVSDDALAPQALQRITAANRDKSSGLENLG